MSTDEPIPPWPVLPPEILEALRQWHEARSDGCWVGSCCAHAEGQWCCVDELLGLTDQQDAPSA